MKTTVVHFRLGLLEKEAIDLNILPNNPNLSDFVRLAVKEKLARDLSHKIEAA